MLFKKEQKAICALNYIFTNDRTLLDLNIRFLRHNTYTDIITFNLSEPGKPIYAEIYISLDRVIENASIHQTKTIEELHRVIFHGALHLCGYKDKTRDDASLMRRKENFYLNKYLAMFHVTRF